MVIHGAASARRMTMYSNSAMTAFAAIVCTLCIFSDFKLHAAEPETLRVMTFNIWVGGESAGQPLDQTVKVIQEARADLVGIQEASGEKRNGERPDKAKIVAKMLGWNYFSQGDGDTSVMSPCKIVGHTPKKWGAQ